MVAWQQQWTGNVWMYRTGYGAADFNADWAIRRVDNYTYDVDITVTGWASPYGDFQQAAKCSIFYTTSTGGYWFQLEQHTANASQGKQTFRVVLGGPSTFHTGYSPFVGIRIAAHYFSGTQTYDDGIGSEGVHSDFILLVDQPDPTPLFTDCVAEFLVPPTGVDLGLDTVELGAVSADAPLTDTNAVGVDINGDGVTDYKVVRTPLNPSIPDPAAPPGSGYKVEITNPEDGTVAVGYLPAGADPNAPLEFRFDGRLITVLYGGSAIVTYLVPQGRYTLNVSQFWVGYVDRDTGARITPLPLFPPPLGGFAYVLNTSFVERPLGFRPHLWLHAVNRVSEAIWEDAEGVLHASRLPEDGALDAPQAKWSLAHGYSAPVSSALATRIWEAGLSRFLEPAP